MLGLKINFHKSDVFCLVKSKDRSALYADILTCPVKSLPLKYLGILIDNKKLYAYQWTQNEENLKKAWGLAR